MSNALLSAAYQCNVRLNSIPDDGSPFLLPQACATTH